MAAPEYQTVENTVGNTPLVRLQRLQGRGCSNTILLKLEGNNPAGSVKDRPALCMIQEAEKAGRIKPGDTLIEATSGAHEPQRSVLDATRQRGSRHQAQMGASNLTRMRHCFVLARTAGAKATLASRSRWRPASRATR
jgi:hypothetical protein